MNDDERTILDPQYTEGNSQNNNSAAQPQQPAQPSQQQSKDKMGWGEKAAYAAGGAVFGAGMTLAGQAMAAPSAEIPVDAPVAPETEDKKDEEVATPESSQTTEAAPETKVTVDEVSGVTVETPGTTVHVTGNADVNINNGNVHVSTGSTPATEAPETSAPQQNVHSQGTPTYTQTAYRTPTHHDSYDHQGPAPDPEDAIVATATGVRVAQVDDSASFSQAFADARAQVGPGGIFEWHGRVYATYYKEEWDSMSAAERHNFQANIDYNDVLTDDSMAQHHNDMAHHSTPSHHDINHHTTQSQQPQHNDDDYQQTAYDDEVHVLDVAQTDLNEDGIPEDAALLEVNGHEIIIVDIDRDGMADIAIADVDGDGQPEYGDISGEGIGMPGMSDGDMYLANNDAPDYTNDANVDYYA